MRLLQLSIRSTDIDINETILLMWIYCCIYFMKKIYSSVRLVREMHSGHLIASVVHVSQGSNTLLCFPCRIDYCSVLSPCVEIVYSFYWIWSLEILIWSSKWWWLFFTSVCVTITWVLAVAGTSAYNVPVQTTADWWQGSVHYFNGYCKLPVDRNCNTGQVHVEIRLDTPTDDIQVYWAKY
jgi:hypothetical protein